MRIVVIGAGGVGGYFGGLLARSGLDLRFGARGDHLLAIQRNGLKVKSVATGAFSVRVSVFDNSEGQDKADLILFCVKSYSNNDAIRLVDGIIDDNTSIITLQNGIGSTDELGTAFGQDKILPGLAYIETSIKSPGVISQTGGPCRIIFGEIDGKISTRVTKITKIFENAGIEIEPSDNILVEIWNKFIFICGLSGVTSITRTSLKEVLDTPETFEILEKVMLETEAVGRAKGIDISTKIVEQTMDRFKEFSTVLKSSMQLDLEKGKPLELEALNGTVSRLGSELGIPTPINSFIYACLKPSNIAGRTR